MIFDIFLLLIIFQLKFFTADYLLQTPYMLQKFRPDWGFALPLLMHAGVHAMFTLAICLLLAPNLWWLVVVDLLTHFIIDRVKAGPKYLGRFKVMSVTDFSMAKQDLCIAKLLNDEREIKKIEKKFKHNAYYWISIGFDQMLHNLVHYYIIFAIIIDKAL